MADCFGIFAGACGLADIFFRVVKKPIVRGKTVARSIELLDSRIENTRKDFEGQTPYFNEASRENAELCQTKVNKALNNIERPPAPPSNPSTGMAKLKYRALLMCYGIRHGKEVEKKVVAVQVLTKRFEEAVRPSGERTTHTYVKGLPNDESVSQVGFGRADKVLQFLREWKNDAAAGASSCKLCFVGIVGHGGLGKTALAKHCLKILENEQNGFHIVAHVELCEKVDNEGVKSKQVSLINRLQRGKANHKDVQTADYGRKKLKEVFKDLAKSRQSVCIIIDDVWKTENLEELLPRDITIPLFTCCIMVTSRVKNIVESLQLHCASRSSCSRHMIFELEPMTEEDSKTLLVDQVISHSRDTSTFTHDEVNNLAEEIYPFCHNVPKALILTGKTLAEQTNTAQIDTTFWDQWKKDMAEDRPGLANKLHSLKNLLDRGYDQLGDELQAAICGIAKCFNGWPQETTINIVGIDRINNLKNYSLLLTENVPMGSPLKMQGLIRKLALDRANSHKGIKWGVVHTPNSGSQSEAFEQVKYLQVDVRNDCEDQDHSTVEGRCFVNMQQLLALDMLGPFVICGRVLQFPESLHFLRFEQNHCLRKVFESMKFPSKLQHLELHGCKDLRELPVTAYNCGSVTYLRIVDSPDLVVLPSTANTQWMKLKVLWLQSCPSVTQLPLGDLGELQLLILNDCKGLVESLSEWAPKLRHGVSLVIDGAPFTPMPSDNSQACSSSVAPAQPDLRAALSDSAKAASIRQPHERAKEQVPHPTKRRITISKFNELTDEEVACLTKLTILAREELCESWLRSVEMKSLKQFKLKYFGWINLECNLFTSASQLTKLCLEKCHQLTELPDSLGSLKFLEELILKECHKLEKLPNTIEHLQCLKKLGLKSCRKIKWLPHTIHKCVSLEKLSLQECSSLECLPRNLVTLKSLKIIRLNGCKNLIDDLRNSIGTLGEHQLEKLELKGLYSKESEVPLQFWKASRKVEWK